MSLVKRPVLTPEKLNANQRNRLQKYQMSLEARERIRRVHLRHGFYSNQSGEAIRALGEDPKDFEELLESLVRAWKPEGEFETLLVRRLARAYWRLERADHFLEAMHVSQGEKVARKLEKLTEAADARYLQAADAVMRLLEAAEEQGTGLGDAETLRRALEQAYGPRPPERPREILRRLDRLAVPGESAVQHLLPGATQPLLPGATQALLPGEVRLEPAQGEERIRLRGELRLLAWDELEALRKEQEQRKRELTPSLRDSWSAACHSRAEFMQGVEDSALRQVERITQTLMKVQKTRKDQPEE